jgi:dTDP-L-rhamnose 4-epimerase
VHGADFPSYLTREAEFIHGDVRDPVGVRAAIEDVDVIFHLAAAVGVGQSMYEIANYMEVNTQGTANLLQALLDSKLRLEKLVVASSMSIYGEGKYRCSKHGVVAPPPRGNVQLIRKQWESLCPVCARELEPMATDESKPLQATSVYALSKKDQEEMCLLYGRTYGLPVVALRYFNIFGTRQALSNPYTGVAAIFASRLLNRKPPLVFEDGEQMRDFVSVHDVVHANLLAMESSGADGMALNIGSGSPITIREVAALLSKSLGLDIEPEITHKFRAGDIRHCFADISAARQLLGYEPRTSFAQGVGELVEWVKSQQAEDRAEAAVAQLVQFGLTA